MTVASLIMCSTFILMAREKEENKHTQKIICKKKDGGGLICPTFLYAETKKRKGKLMLVHN